ncbi:MAG: hypothetical protein HY367_04135 [Candidatus Aenigmarchaeota archaeon]|nr:hypothetical protein [Candidatus Aenigmarchaeota archaeon]
MPVEPEILSYIAAALVAGIFLFFMGFRWLRQKRLIENIPTSKVRSLAMGLVEVYGKAVPAKALRSELTGEACVYYRYAIEELRQTGKSAVWVTILSGKGQESFYLKDNTGSVLIIPQDAEVDIPPDLQFESGWGRDPPESVKAFMKNHGKSYEGFLGINKKMRFTEWHIAPGDMLYVMGTASGSPVKTSGRVGEKIVIMKGENEGIFYISDRQEKDIIRSLAWKSALGLIGGGAMIVLGILGVVMLANY